MHRAIKKANSLLAECHKETDHFLNEQQLHPILSQPPDEEMMETDENKKVSSHCLLINVCLAK